MSSLYQNDLSFLNDRGDIALAGIDEAGRGALAGPVVVAAVVLDYNKLIPGLNDSKKLSDIKRRQLYKQILEQARGVSVVEVSAAEVDRINVLQASILGFGLACNGLKLAIDYALIDGRDVPVAMKDKAQAIIKGDSIYACIAAASIVAKVHRDDLMIALDDRFPQYGFAQHKGYPTAQHYQALMDWGACPMHRQSYRLS
ncbi:MAG: ribonuclease HII [Candidatus Cloacimonadaceae bacterium]|jgi:ribonuclease HII|nr:ribonuclease HII [Candidatus Cloacimonadota bacterium]MCK9335282.1 ribonuclease HII [Candidatus Cloacimonadota bacterium]MDD2543009.1 ribonuclease HII [Candidatus Cloacimonadota bacterium]MDD4034041.1 ribonuclease HII [Candidatus Cloacimonadota bacterium]MDY0336950.1 ribonuclease HII [Candidatus Cloacimonadaceae bacterium]